MNFFLSTIDLDELLPIEAHQLNQEVKQIEQLNSILSDADASESTQVRGVNSITASESALRIHKLGVWAIPQRQLTLRGLSSQIRLMTQDRRMLRVALVILIDIQHDMLPDQFHLKVHYHLSMIY